MQTCPCFRDYHLCCMEWPPYFLPVLVLVRRRAATMISFPTLVPLSFSGRPLFCCHAREKRHSVRPVNSFRGLSRASLGTFFIDWRASIMKAFHAGRPSAASVLHLEHQRTSIQPFLLGTLKRHCVGEALSLEVFGGGHRGRQTGSLHRVTYGNAIS